MSTDALKYETDTLTETTNCSEDSTTSEASPFKMHKHPEFRFNRSEERTMKRFFYCGGNVGIKRITLAILILNTLWSWAVGVAGVYFDILYNQAEFHRQFIHVYVCVVQTIIHYYTITGVVKSIVWNMQVYIMYT
uniref:G_PROTEIN_RECEP_F1_2 domain-containing protein n=3 Tax=Bursaphelenchus xylophilus TaxID=6326 RepID=A0A1I7SHE7_BURXY